MFLHASVIHLGMNVLFLWWIAAPVEQAIGRGALALIYLVADSEARPARSSSEVRPHPGRRRSAPRVRCSGSWVRRSSSSGSGNYVLGGAALTIIVINLVLSFTISGISIGGHLGGLVGGALCALALSRLGSAHAMYGRPGLAGVAGVLAIALGSVALSYWAVADTCSAATLGRCAGSRPRPRTPASPTARSAAARRPRWPGALRAADRAADAGRARSSSAGDTPFDQELPAARADADDRAGRGSTITPLAIAQGSR